MKLANTVVILDFETTGLSPDNGDRAIEIGAVRIENGQITDRFQELMNPGRRINSFIEDYTGITNNMLKTVSSCADVMTRFHQFIGDDNLVAHNASFDKRFLDAEFKRLNLDYSGSFACSLLVARRIYQQAPDHKLGTLVRYKGLDAKGDFHRALFDAEMTTKLWLIMLEDMSERYNLAQVSFDMITKLSKKSKSSIGAFLNAQ